jgi:arylsulfatase A-like enzyme
MKAKKRKYKNIFCSLIIVMCFITTTFSQRIITNPNVVVILSDDQGWGDLSINGNKNLNTPNIDSQAQSGAIFKYFYVSPVCSPTRAEFLTGRYHARSNVYSTSTGGERMDLDETTIAQIFGKAGYSTAMFGKWHNGTQAPYHPSTRGFDEFYGFTSGHWGNYFSSLFLDHNGKLVKGKGYLENDLTNRAVSFMEEHREKPFFVYIAYNTPHSPMQVSDRWWNKFKNKKLTMFNRDPEKEDTTFTKAALAMCENLDWNVGRIRNKIAELGLTRNTIVVYLSDNGPNSWRWNGGMKGKKGSVDEGGVRTPCFIEWPGKIKAGEKISEIAADIDLLPTLADLAGIKISSKKTLDGKSLKPLLLGNSNIWPSRLLYSSWAGRSSVRSQKYRLDDKGQLFDMENDPGQLYNIAKEKTDIAQTLYDSLKEWQINVLSEINRNADRPFTIGYPDFKYTLLPARDGSGHGAIERSNRWPNSSFFTHWINVSDKITWNVDVMASGDFKVELYYTCPKKDIGSTIELQFGKSKITGKLTEAFDPPLRGMENDRVERQESYVKDWKLKELGSIHLDKGIGTLTLGATHMPGAQVMDFRLLMLTRVNN